METTLRYVILYRASVCHVFSHPLPSVCVPNWQKWTGQKLPSLSRRVYSSETAHRSLAIHNIISYRTNGHLKMNNDTISVRKLSDVTEKPTQWINLVPHFSWSDHQGRLSLSRVNGDQMLAEVALLCFLLSSSCACAAPTFTMWSSGGSGL